VRSSAESRNCFAGTCCGALVLMCEERGLESKPACKIQIRTFATRASQPAGFAARRKWADAQPGYITDRLWDGSPYGTHLSQHDPTTSCLFRYVRVCSSGYNAVPCVVNKYNSHTKFDIYLYAVADIPAGEEVKVLSGPIVDGQDSCKGA
jgi:hypothetical protein